MSKKERLQLRMELRLKNWFKGFSEGRGGMSRIVTDYVTALKKADDDEEGNGEQSQQRE